MSSWSDMPGRGPKRRSLRTVSGGFMSFSGVVLLIGSVFVFSRFAKLLAERGEDFGEVAGFALTLINYRWLVALPALIAIGCGVMLFFTTRMSVRAPLLIVGWLSMFLPFAAVAYTLFALLIPLYTYRDL